MMKKLPISLVSAFVALSALAEDLPPLVDTNQAVTVQIGVYDGTTLNSEDVVTTLSDVPFRFLTRPVGVRFTSSDGLWSLSIPNMNLSGSIGLRPRGLSYSQCPVQDNAQGLAYPYKYFPTLQALYRFIEVCYLSGVASSAFVEQAHTTGGIEAKYYNVDVPTMFAQCLSSTNGVWRSTVVDFLASFRSELQAFRADFDEVGSLNYDILDAVNKIETSYSQVNYFDLVPFTNSLSSALSSGYISQSEYDRRLQEYNALSSNPARQTEYARNTQSYLNSVRKVDDNITATLNNPFSSELGDKMNEGLKNSVDRGFSASFSIGGVVTNQLGRMTNDTAQIKQDLQAWHDDATNRLDRQWDGIKDVKKNTADTAAATTDIAANGVKIKGPIEVYTDSDFKANVTVADATLATINNSIASGADQAMQRWLDEWYSFTGDQSSWQFDFSELIRSNADNVASIASRFDLSWTNILDACVLQGIISNGVAGLDLSLTNELWNYYFEQFKRADNFTDKNDSAFRIADFRSRVFGSGFDEGEYSNLDWFSRVELLLYQLTYVTTNDAPTEIEPPDLEGYFDSVSSDFDLAGEDFVASSVRVVGVFKMLERFADTVKKAFVNASSPSTAGITLLEGGSWLVNEPLVLKIPIEVQNTARLVFQCIWYLSAVVLAWRVLSVAWSHVVKICRWLWSLFDV